MVEPEAVVEPLTCHVYVGETDSSGSLTVAEQVSIDELYTFELGEIEIESTLGAELETVTEALFAVAETPMESVTVAEQ